MKVKKKAVLGQISDMDLRLLRVFRAVVDCGGMAAAELELNIGTSTLLAATDAFRAGVDAIHQRMGGALHLAVFDKTATNPASRIHCALAQFTLEAPAVALHLHVGTLNAIERGVLDGTFQIGIVPGHRSSELLRYDRLFGETMHMYCGASHPLYRAAVDSVGWADLRAYRFAGL